MQMTETTVVNIRNEPCCIKITRKPNGLLAATPGFGYYGNPFTVEEYGREECLRLYKEYFDNRIVTDPVFRAAILSLRGKRLGCFCKPLACHGDIIKEWLDNHAANHNQNNS